MMHNLTKEEIIFIRDTLQWMVSTRVEPISTYALKDKIVSMIEYKNKQESCEHSWEYEFNDYHCLKCELRR